MLNTHRCTHVPRNSDDCSPPELQISEAAIKRLNKLLPSHAVGFSVTDILGTCRGSTPAINPARYPVDNQRTLHCAGLTFFVNADLADRFSCCTLDDDRSFFGKGLTARWPQNPGCNCHS